MYKHILISTDGSELSREAIAAGVKFAKSVGAKVTGLFAAPPPSSPWRRARPTSPTCSRRAGRRPRRSPY